MSQAPDQLYIGFYGVEGQWFEGWVPRADLAAWQQHAGRVWYLLDTPIMCVRAPCPKGSPQWVEYTPPAPDAGPNMSMGRLRDPGPGFIMTYPGRRRSAQGVDDQGYYEPPPPEQGSAGEDAQPPSGRSEMASGGQTQDPRTLPPLTLQDIWPGFRLGIDQPPGYIDVQALGGRPLVIGGEFGGGLPGPRYANSTEELQGMTVAQLRWAAARMIREAEREIETMEAGEQEAATRKLDRARQQLAAGDVTQAPMLRSTYYRIAYDTAKRAVGIELPAFLMGQANALPRELPRVSDYEMEAELGETPQASDAGGEEAVQKGWQTARRLQREGKTRRQAERHTELLDFYLNKSLERDAELPARLLDGRWQANAHRARASGRRGNARCDCTPTPPLSNCVVSDADLVCMAHCARRGNGRR